jgi:hypothetical protein
MKHQLAGKRQNVDVRRGKRVALEVATTALRASSPCSLLDDKAA